MTAMGRGEIGGSAAGLSLGTYFSQSNMLCGTSDSLLLNFCFMGGEGKPEVQTANKSAGISTSEMCKLLLRVISWPPKKHTKNPATVLYLLQETPRIILCI